MRSKNKMSITVTRKLQKKLLYLIYLTHLSTDQIFNRFGQKNQDYCSKLHLDRHLYGHISSDTLYIIVDEINEEYRTATKLYLDGKKTKEISLETGIPLRKIQYQIYCGTMEIKDRLRQL
ncbi:hypothetical protein [Coprobacter sp.]